MTPTPTKICKRCHTAKPVALFSPRADAKDKLAYWCTPCKTAATRASPQRAQVTKGYRERNKKVCIARTLASRGKNPEQSAERARQASARYAAANHAGVLLRRRAAYEKNPAGHIARSMLRKERTTVLQPWIDQAKLAEMNGVYMFCRIFPGFEVDHVVPLNGKTVSGLHVPENLQVLTVRANRQKGARFAG